MHVLRKEARFLWQTHQAAETSKERSAALGRLARGGLATPPLDRVACVELLSSRVRQELPRQASEKQILRGVLAF